MLEPFGRVARRILEFHHFELALFLIFLERGVEAGQVDVRAIQDLGELDRILERELGARADREMRGMRGIAEQRSEEHTSELQSLMRISYAVFCLKKKQTTTHNNTATRTNTNTK